MLSANTSDVALLRCQPTSSPLGRTYALNHDQALVEACRTDLDQALNDWRRLNPDIVHGLRTMGPHPSEACRLPREHAAAVVLNVHGHLHPIESRTVVCATRLVAQRKARWTAQAAGTLADLRRYLAARAAIHMPIAA
jgi:hypothetical protein